MELNDLVDAFEAAAATNTYVKGFHHGNFSDINTLDHEQFPYALLIAEDGGHDDINSRGIYTTRLLIIDTYDLDKQEVKTQAELWADEKRNGLVMWRAAMVAPDYIYDRKGFAIDFFKKVFNGLYSICEIANPVTTTECLT